jgi:hypothetical protein
VAFCDVLTEASQSIVDVSAYWKVQPKTGPRVRIRYTGIPIRPLVFPGEALPTELATPSVNGSQGTVFRVSPEQWTAVLRLAVGVLTVRPEWVSRNSR